MLEQSLLTLRWPLQWGACELGGCDNGTHLVCWKDVSAGLRESCYGPKLKGKSYVCVFKVHCVYMDRHVCLYVYVCVQSVHKQSSAKGTDGVGGRHQSLILSDGFPFHHLVNPCTISAPCKRVVPGQDYHHRLLCRASSSLLLEHSRQIALRCTIAISLSLGATKKSIHTAHERHTATKWITLLLQITASLTCRIFVKFVKISPGFSYAGIFNLNQILPHIIDDELQETGELTGNHKRFSAVFFQIILSSLAVVKCFHSVLITLHLSVSTIWIRRFFILPSVC